MADDVIELPTFDIPDELKIDSNKPSAPANAPPQEPDPNAQPPRRPGSKELAVLEVRGKNYSNWTSVRVEQKWTDTFPTFTFECTEETPVPLAINGAQFVPGDVVSVYLGGHQSVFGYITERHVGYDGQSHGVRLIGCGDTADLVNSSVPLDKLSGHDGKSVTQLATALAAHLGIQVHTVGAVDNTPFDNVQVLPGETPIQAVERYAKMRNIIIGSQATGGLLLIGEHPAAAGGQLWEGTHIERANCVVRDNMVFNKIFSVGQNVGSDTASGDPENKQVAERDGSSPRNRHLVVVADVADKPHGVQRRADMEAVFTEGSNIEAQITVQGWFKDNNMSEDIWRAGEYYTVNSPSLILYDELLGCAGCVYEQDAQGTRTTLQLVRPIHMNGRVNFLTKGVEDRAKQMADAKAAADAAAAAAQAKKDADTGQNV